MSKKKFYKSFLVLTAVLLLFQTLSLYSFAQQSENSDPSVYADADPSADPSGGEQAGEKLKAYPGAEGFGAYSTGGRGGEVYHVTNLEPSGEGSLTYGLEELSGARTIVFDVGGVIDLTELGRDIQLSGAEDSGITIAGQSAPYPGITLKGYGISITNASDIIIRNIRIRNGGVRPDGELYDATPLAISASENIIVDHCSMQWGQRYNFEITGKNITLSNNIFGNPISENSAYDSQYYARYGGIVDAGSERTTFAKNFVGNARQRNPRFANSDYVDIYNNILYNIGTEIDIFNSAPANKVFKTNMRSNFVVSGPVQRVTRIARVARQSEINGGTMLYMDGNYYNYSGQSIQNDHVRATSYQDELDFGVDNGEYGSDYDLSSVTLEEWENNPASYRVDGETPPPIVYGNYPFYAPTGYIMSVFDESGANNLINYAVTDESIGANRPARDLYDTMKLAEIRGRTATTASLTSDETAAYFEELEKRTGLDLSEYKTARTWTVRCGDGPVLVGAEDTNPKPVDWDNYTDVNGNGDKYIYTTNFEIGDWWGEYCGAPGQRTVYTLKNIETGETVKTLYPGYDESVYTLESSDIEYVPVERTVADLYPDEELRSSYPEAAEFMDDYRTQNYANASDGDKIVWDGAGDGIPDWYKAYRGLSASEDLSKAVDPDTGYTYLEEYLQLMACDQDAGSSAELSIENFKANNIGCASAQVFWNTTLAASCVIEYGTEPGNYTNRAELEYSEETDGYNTYHARTLTGLTPNTTYYYRVTATADNGSAATAEYSPDVEATKAMSFTTAAAPAGWETEPPAKPYIAEIEAYSGKVTLKWSGDIDSTESYAIYYDTVDRGSDVALYANKIEGISPAQSSYTIDGLTDGTRYYFVVSAINKNGSTASDSAAKTPSGILLDYDFTSMTDAEKEAFMSENAFYTLGGTVGIAQDPDTGEEALNLLDETFSHKVSADIKLPYAQDDVFTYEMRMKILYQKQNDALVNQNGVYAVSQSEPGRTTLNFYRDDIPAEDMNTEDSGLWSDAFALKFNSVSEPISVTDGRYDGTTETGSIAFGDKTIGSYKSGITAPFSEDLNTVLPPNLKYDISKYNYTTAYGDAIYGYMMDAKKTCCAWYYEKGSAEYVDYKVVVDPKNNNVKVYANDQLLEEGAFAETALQPYNVGKIGIETQNGGYAWINIESIRAYTGEEYETDPDPTLPPAPTAKPTPSPSAKPTLAPDPTEKPGYITEIHRFSDNDFEGLSSLPANTEVGGITVSKDSSLTDSDKTFSTETYPENSGLQYSKVLKIGTAELKFKVPGDCRITIDAVTANSGQSRSYSVYAGSAKLGEFTCIPNIDRSYSVEYTGDAAEISIVPAAGINVYGIIVEYEEAAAPTVTPTPTEVPTATPVPTGEPTAAPIENWSIDGYENGAVRITAPTDAIPGEKNYILIAEYGENDMLTDCEIIEFEVEENKTYYEIITDKAISGENVKIMLWDDVLRPLTPVYAIS
ncbi:MAG TPA: fibronectin type III domain-containing protein [Firmicutes bacterium]|nr:fibronectin type III domain-containing protein [Bacillota bacterium]